MIGLANNFILVHSMQMALPRNHTWHKVRTPLKQHQYFPNNLKHMLRVYLSFWWIMRCALSYLHIYCDFLMHTFVMQNWAQDSSIYTSVCALLQAILIIYVFCDSHKLCICSICQSKCTLTYGAYMLYNTVLAQEWNTF